MTWHSMALPEHVWNSIATALDEDLERAGMLIGTVMDDDQFTFLVNRIEWMSDDAYHRRAPDELIVGSEAWAPTVRATARTGETAAFLHTHPGGEARFSTRDEVVDLALAEAYGRLTSGGYIAVVAAGRSASPAVAARRVRSSGDIVEFDTIRVVGEKLRLWPSGDNPVDLALHDRQVRALGSDGQKILGALRVGLVGLGGTGSPVYEMLHRLGVGYIVTIDDDVVTEATPSRGSYYATRHLGQPKVEVMREMSQHLRMSTDIEVVKGDVTHHDVASRLAHCDVIFACTDGHASRLVVNRMPYWLLAPIIDVGVLVDSSVDGQVDVTGRVTWISPGTACLTCRDRINRQVAQAEMLDPEERRALAGEGYVPDIDTPAPSVVAYTTMMAAYAVDELLRRLLDLGTTSVATESLIQISKRRVSNNRVEPTHGCFCSDSARWARGGLEPRLDQMWVQ